MTNSVVQNVALLNKLPITWQVLPFHEIVGDVSSGNKKTLKSDFLEEGKYVIVDQGQELFAGYTNKTELLVKAAPPYIVFGDHTRAIKYIDVPFAMGADGTKVLKPTTSSKLHEKYLYYFFLTLNIPNTGYNRHFKYLKASQIPLPPLTEQKQIATILDAADMLRQKNQQLVEHYTQLSQSLFLEMFGDPVTNPNGWKITKFLEVFQVRTGKLDSNAASDKGMYPFFTCAKDPLMIDSYSYDEEALLLAGNNAAGIFDVKHYKGKFDAYQRTYILNLDQKSFVYEYMKIALEQKLKDLQRISIGSSTQYLTMKILERLVFQSPSIELQNQFAERVEKIEQQIQQAQANLEKSNDLFNALLQKAFTGELTQNQAA